MARCLDGASGTVWCRSIPCPTQRSIQLTYFLPIPSASMFCSHSTTLEYQQDNIFAISEQVPHIGLIFPVPVAFALSRYHHNCGDEISTFTLRKRAYDEFDDAKYNEAGAGAVTGTRAVHHEPTPTTISTPTSTLWNCMLASRVPSRLRLRSHRVAAG